MSGSNEYPWGEHFLVGLEGTSLTPRDCELLTKWRPAGILLFKRNYHHDRPYAEWIKALGNLLQDVKGCLKRERFIISTDHEGGRIHCAPPPITHFPYASKYASRTVDVAKAMATELKSLGVNLSWAPVIDIHSNPDNPVIGERAFGTTARSVIRASVPFDRVMREGGILTCAKHYPGHGDTSTDSHLELPTIDRSEDDLRERELLPFRALVESGVSSIMTAHVLFKALDDKPATYSKKILHDIVRRDWQYKGLIVADDVGMQAVRTEFLSGNATAEAIGAGCDLLIASRHRHEDGVDDFEGSISRLRELGNGGAVDTALRDEARTRIQKVLEALPAFQAPRMLEEDVLAAHERLRASLDGWFFGKSPPD